MVLVSYPHALIRFYFTGWRSPQNIPGRGRWDCTNRTAALPPSWSTGDCSHRRRLSSSSSAPLGYFRDCLVGSLLRSLRDCFVSSWPDCATSTYELLASKSLDDGKADAVGVVGVVGVSKGSFAGSDVNFVEMVGAGGSSFATLDTTTDSFSLGGGASGGIDGAVDVGGYKNDPGTLVSRFAGIVVERNACVAWESAFPGGAYECTRSCDPNVIVV